MQGNDSHRCCCNQYLATNHRSRRSCTSCPKLSHHHCRTSHCMKPLRTRRASWYSHQGRRLPEHPNQCTAQNCHDFFLSIPQVSRDKVNGIYVLHRHAVIVDWIGGRLAAELTARGRSAQIVNLDDDGVPERSCGRGRVWVGGWRYLEAAPASAARTAVGTKCELVNRSRVPIHFLAARCRRTLRSAGSKG